MKVFDFRSPVERRLRQWWTNSSLTRTRSNGPGELWSRLAESWTLHQVSKRQSPPNGPFIISVGNLALGGTGKTPVIMDLARSIARSLAQDNPGFKPQGCILTRGYKSPLAGPLEVAPENPLAGDEARLMAQHLSDIQWPVVQCRNRLAGLSFALKHWPQLSFVLVEDGHQTARIGRHLDILILDNWRVTHNSNEEVVEPLAGSVFPLGSYRESVKGTERAHVFLMENPADVAGLGPQGQPVFCFKRRIRLHQVQGEKSDLRPTGSYVCLSGIARPEQFERNLESLLGRAPEMAIRLKDHQDYSGSWGRKIREILASGAALPLVTTAKDWVKLEGELPDGLPVHVAQLELDWQQEGALLQLVKERANNTPGGSYSSVIHP